MCVIHLRLYLKKLFKINLQPHPIKSYSGKCSVVAEKFFIFLKCIKIVQTILKEISFVPLFLKKCTRGTGKFCGVAEKFSIFLTCIKIVQIILKKISLVPLFLKKCTRGNWEILWGCRKIFYIPNMYKDSTNYSKKNFVGTPIFKKVYPGELGNFVGLQKNFLYS